MTASALFRTLRVATAPAILLLATACGSAGGGAEAEQQPAPQADASGVTQNAPWALKTREHVDLWLHGFAMLVDDTARVPWFRRGYRDQMVVLKNRANVTTMLDANRDRLRARFGTNRLLPIQGQFLALYADDWNDLVEAAQLFLQAEGNPQRANSQQAATAIALFAQTFPAAADREWLRLFMQSLDDERQKYYHGYWLSEQRARDATLAAIDSSWHRVHRPRLQGFLNNSRQASGSVLLSLPIGGEGRTIATGGAGSIATVTFPETRAAADEAIYVFVHEAVGQLAASAVGDNVTPNERREGLADRLQAAAAVRTGYMVLARVDPALAPGYAEFYLRAANAPRTSGTVESRLAAAFPLPSTIADAIGRQLDVVLGGI